MEFVNITRVQINAHYTSSKHLLMLGSFGFAGFLVEVIQSNDFNARLVDKSVNDFSAYACHGHAMLRDEARPALSSK
jgi:hypothetical protein